MYINDVIKDMISGTSLNSNECLSSMCNINTYIQVYTYTDCSCHLHTLLSNTKSTIIIDRVRYKLQYKFRYYNKNYHILQNNDKNIILALNTNNKIQILHHWTDISEVYSKKYYIYNVNRINLFLLLLFCVYIIFMVSILLYY
jgi:hypothetical protein